MTVSRIEDVLEDLRNGKMIILVDDEDRENEGDLTIAAEKITPEAINFMKKIRLEQLPGVERELLCAKIRVTMNSGEQYEKLIESPKGDPLGNPLTKDDIFNKFLSNLEFSKKIDSLKGKKLISLLDRLEELENINEVINLLT